MGVGEKMTNRKEKIAERNALEYEELVLLLSKDVVKHYITIYEEIKDKPLVTTDFNTFVRDVFLRKLKHANSLLEKEREESIRRKEELELVTKRFDSLQLHQSEELEESQRRVERLEEERDEQSSHIGDTLLKNSELESKVVTCKELLGRMEDKIRKLEEELEEAKRPSIMTTDPRSKFLIKKKKSLEEEKLEGVVMTLRRENEILRKRLEGKK